MGQITSGIGLVSGINTSSIIDQLMAIEQRPVTLLQARVKGISDQKAAYTDLATQLGTLNTAATDLGKAETFQQSQATSSDENVLSATAAPNAATGSFQFQVTRLVTTQQSISTGFVDPTSVKVGGGTITIEEGGGELSSQTPLSALNGGAGVRRGQFRITDRSGKSDVIDITNAVSLDDVVRKINTSLDISVRAKIDHDGIVLSDTSGQTTGNLVVQDLGDGNAAADLGLVNNVADTVITGTSINFLGRATTLSSLNDARGVRDANGAADFRIVDSHGAAHDVTIHNLANLGQVADAINSATSGAVKASLANGAHGITLTDSAGGSLSVSALNNSQAAADLGIQSSGSGTINGTAIQASLNTVLLSSLKGGAGLSSLGAFSITDKAGHSATINLAGSASVQDIIDKINAAAGPGALGIKASLKQSGNGIQISDSTGSAGNLVVADVSGTSAQQLGLVANTSDVQINGANLQRKWFSETSLLSDLNGGKGIAQTKFTLTDSAGKTADVDLSNGNTQTVGQLISLINSRGIGVTASINANGDGLLLTDTANGAAKLKVVDDSGTAAADLNISGTATATTLDGSYEKTITLDQNDTLTSAQNKINTLGFGVSASIINDGSGQAPFRLSLSSKNSGRAGRVSFDGGASGIQTRNLVEAQDAAVFLGGADSAEPILITSSKNQLANVIKGVTVELHGTSDKPVTLGVTRTSDNVVKELGDFTDNFNKLVTKIKTLTSFDTTTNKPGLLLGDSTTDQIQTEIYAMLNTVVKGAGKFKILADIGITIGDKAVLSFDQDKFKSAYADDPKAVEALFSQADTGIAAVMQANLKRLVDPANGLVTLEGKTLDDRTTQFQDRIKSLDDLLAAKRTRLETQFANMESVLAGLQSQQQALGSLGTITASPPSPPTTSSSSKTTSTAA